MHIYILLLKITSRFRQVYFQLGGYNLYHLTLLNLLEQLLYEPFYDTLRTNAQMGYSVNCGIRETFGVLGFCFTVTSASHSIEEVRKAIYAFVENIPHFISSMKLTATDTENAGDM